MRSVYAAAVLAAGLAATAVPAADPPGLVRVVVLDTSTSMGGGRIATAKAELLALARALPPAPDRPLVVVPFSDRVGDVRAFTDLPACEAYLAGVSAGGGTRIAAGLERGLAELARHPDARHACVLLYTDGEDPDLDGIRRQEEHLDRLFADRQRRGLAQSVVFKRWGQANDALLRQVTARGRAAVIDAGDTALVAVTLTPAVAATAARWAKGRPGVVEVDLAASVSAAGLPAGAVAPAVRLACRTPGAAGDLAADVRAGTPATLRVHVPAPPAGPVVVEFAAVPPAEVMTPGGMLFPLLARDRVLVTVPLPPPDVACALSATAAADGVPGWADPVRRIARVSLRVGAGVRPPEGAAWPGDVAVRVAPPPGWRVVAGTDTWTLAGPAAAERSVTVEGPLPAPGRHPLPVVVSGARLPPGVSLAPAEVRVTADVPVPPPVPCVLGARVTAVGPARWADVAQGVAAFAADVEVRVEGPLPAGSKVLVRSPPGVRAVRFTPDTIRPGVQTVRFDVEAAVAAAPRRTALTFDLAPPPLPDTIAATVPTPLRVDVAGPPAARVALVRRGAAPAVLPVDARDGGTFAPLHAAPALTGLADPAAGRGVRVRVAGGAGLDWSGADRPLAADARPSLAVRLPPGRETSFFYDTVAEAEVALTPDPPAAAVTGSRQTVRLRVEAPFKRLLFYAASGLSALAAAYFLARMVRRLAAGGGP